MFSLFPRHSDRRLTRRMLLQLGSLTASGLALSDVLVAADGLSQTSAESGRRATAKNCIYIFLCGGPSQPDLWDMKPQAPTGVRSVFSPIQTSVPGLHFGELLPQVATLAGKLALIRSMTHSNNDHNGAIAHTLLGQIPPRPADVYLDRNDHPALGGILHKLLGSGAELPAWVVLPRAFTTLSPPHKGQCAGFLGAAYDPLMFDKEQKGSLTTAPLRLEALLPPEGMDARRLDQRQVLRGRLGQPISCAAAGQLGSFYDKAYTLLAHPHTRKVFDLEQESANLRDRYGRNEYGQSFLMARRLVEAGVRFVNVFWTFFDTKGCQFNLWDNHGVANDVCGVDGQFTGVKQLTHQYCTPSFDRAFSALLEDLDQRGLLDETLVAVAGEFGRTPKINATSGRDHWAHCYTQLLAGGGIRGGQVYGASDAVGTYVKDRPVTPDDFAATILYAFGLSPETAIPDTTGRPVRISTGTPVVALF